jgi:putative ABC transport system ATP-binding protein
VSVVLQCFVGLVVLAFYHPFFLIFDFILLATLWGIYRVMGSNAFEANYEESTQKYKVAAWLETLSRRNLFFRSVSGEKFAEKKTDEVLTEYIEKRRRYFSLYILIVGLTLVIYTLSTSFLLGIGGWLVTKNQLSLGQLVAAELILAIILGGVAKSGKLLDAFFDLKSALKKLNQFESIGFESEMKGSKVIDPLEKLKFNQVESHQDSGVYIYNQQFLKGKIYSIQTYSSSSKLYFTRLILSLVAPTKGAIYWNNSSLSILDASSLREKITIINEAHFFHGTIKENLTCLYPDANPAQISDILEGCDLNDIITRLPHGIDTVINEDGYPLSLSQSYRLNLATNLFTSKDLIILDQWVDLMEESKKMALLKYLRQKFPDAIIIFFGTAIDSMFEMEKLTLTRNGFKYE